MSGVLHPVGPEPAATYWLRRALVLGVLALVAVVVTALVGPGTRQQQAVPAVVSVAPMVDATPSTSVPAAGSGSGAASAALRASPTRTAAKAAAGGARSARAGRSKSRPSTVSARKPSALPSCAASRLRTTLTGHNRLKVQQSTTFDVSVINGSARSCLVRITERSFAITIYSGRDRIWSTRDCATAVGDHEQKLASQSAMAWRLTWDGRRSKAGCKSRPESVRAGTYVATAQLKGAKPVRHRMVLHG